MILSLQIDGVYGNAHIINLSVIAFVMFSSVLFPHCNFTANTLLHLTLCTSQYMSAQNLYCGLEWL